MYLDHDLASITICICSDEPIDCLTIKSAAQDWAKKRRVQFVVYHDPNSLLGSTRSYDILFLGIQFSCKETGVDIARRLREKGSKAILIFFTGHGAFAPEAYEVEAFRFLLKPLQADKFQEAMNAASILLKGSRPGIALRSDGGIILLPAVSISRIESVARRRIVHADGQEVFTWETMQSLFSKLPIGEFAWVQKGVVVNLAAVSKVKNNIVTLHDGHKISLSRNYKMAFFALLGRYTGAFPAGPAMSMQS